MANRHKEMDAQISEIKGRISGKGAEAPKATHRYNLQTGKIEAIPSGKIEAIP
jgi:hypothetical protein